MRTVWFAAGLAAGYVFGTKAGREKYEEIVATARKVAADPRVTSAQTQAKELISDAGDAMAAKLNLATPSDKTVNGALG